MKKEWAENLDLERDCWCCNFGEELLPKEDWHLHADVSVRA